MVNKVENIITVINYIENNLTEKTELILYCDGCWLFKISFA